MRDAAGELAPVHKQRYYQLQTRRQHGLIRNIQQSAVPLVFPLCRADLIESCPLCTLLVRCSKTSAVIAAALIRLLVPSRKRSCSVANVAPVSHHVFVASERSHKHVPTNIWTQSCSSALLSKERACDYPSADETNHSFKCSPRAP